VIRPPTAPTPRQPRRWSCTVSTGGSSDCSPRNEIRFSPDPLRAGYPWCRASSQPQKVRFAPDSALEEDGFELAVPPRRERLWAVTPGKHCRFGLEPVSGSAFRAAVSDWQRREEPFAGAGPMVRIRFSPAASPSLHRIRFRRSRNPAFRASVTSVKSERGAPKGISMREPWHPSWSRSKWSSTRKSCTGWASMPMQSPSAVMSSSARESHEADRN
jgi:hypothetical protein